MLGALFAELVWLTGLYTGVVSCVGGLDAVLGAVTSALCLISGEVINVLNAFF